MNKLETLGFILAIFIAIYLYREVNQLKKQASQDDPSKTHVKYEDVNEEKGGLKRLQGYRLGHRQEVDVGNGEKLTLITRALQPLAFEIPNFLSDSEMQLLLDKAKSQNLKMSEAKAGLAKPVVYIKSEEKGKAKDPLGQFKFWDTNSDGFIDIDEAKDAVKRHNLFVVPEQDDIRNMFTKLCPEAFEDDLISESEWDEIDTINIEDQINFWYAEDHRFKPRHSEQTWLHWEKGVLMDIRQRVVKLTNLPEDVVYGGEPMQVAHYYPSGHYHAHYDSETHQRPELPCCHQHLNGLTDGSGNCVLCRFITIMTYMNDVEEGGETAFVIADNQTYTSAIEKERLNLSKHCKDANLVVSPKKGTALFWYNHYVDAESQFLGALDGSSLHGGCDVIKGEKWISNIWLTATYKNHKHKRSVYLQK